MGRQTGGDWTLGAADGAGAVFLARAFGFAAGGPIVLDLEAETWAAAVNGGYVDGVVTYVSDWCAAVATGGYEPGVYSGADALVRLRPVYRFAFLASWGIAPDPAYELHQFQQVAAAGLTVDEDIHLSAADPAFRFARLTA